MLHHLNSSGVPQAFADGRSPAADLDSISLLHRAHYGHTSNWRIPSVPAYQNTAHEGDWDFSGISPASGNSNASYVGMNGVIDAQDSPGQHLSSYPLPWPQRSWGYSMPDLNAGPSTLAYTPLSDAESTVPSSPESQSRGSIGASVLPKIPQAATFSVPTRRRRKSEGADLRAQYPCDFCSVRMSRLHDINRHMRLHTNEKPYECLGCGQTFRRTDARARHWTKHESCLTAHRIREPAGARTRQRISLRVQHDLALAITNTNPHGGGLTS